LYLKQLLIFPSFTSSRYIRCNCRLDRISYITYLLDAN